MSKLDRVNEKYPGRHNKNTVEYTKARERAIREDREEAQRKREKAERIHQSYSSYNHYHQQPKLQVKKEPEPQQTWGEMFAGVKKDFNNFFGFASSEVPGIVHSLPPPQKNLGTALSRSSSWELIPSPNQHTGVSHTPVNNMFPQTQKPFNTVLKPNQLVFTGQYTNWGKVIHCNGTEGTPLCIIYENDLSAQFRIGVRTAQSQYIATITKYRSIMFPDKLAQQRESLELTFAISKPDGNRIAAKDVAYLKLNYDEDGRLIKLSIPGNITVPGFDPNLPVITMYHGAPYVVPITVGTFKFLEKIVIQNNGVIEIGNTEQGAMAEYIF